VKDSIHIQIPHLKTKIFYHNNILKAVEFSTAFFMKIL
jgi:hypothetical protein